MHKFNFLNWLYMNDEWCIVFARGTFFRKCCKCLFRHFHYTTSRIKVSFFYAKSRTCSFIVYYTTRADNPLKKMQSLIVIACKILRVIYTILKTGRDYDPQKNVKGHQTAKSCISRKSSIKSKTVNTSRTLSSLW